MASSDEGLGATMTVEDKAFPEALEHSVVESLASCAIHFKHGA